MIRDRVILGAIFGLASALGYTAANIFLRKLASCDPAWVSCIKAIPTIVLFGPWLVVLAWRGQRVVPAPRTVVALVLAALLGHIGGNVCFQWSLGIVGIALAVPVCIGMIIVSGAVMGRMYLSETVTVRTVIATAILIAAIFVLSLGAGDAHRSIAESAAMQSNFVNVWYLVAGITAAAFAGFAYSVLGVVIRFSLIDESPVSTAVVLVATVGLISLGFMSWLRIGMAGMLATSPDNLGLMILAGICNAFAFGTLGKALELTTVTFVNILNASQVAMCAIAGVLVFAEPPTGAMIAGVIMTMLGLVAMKRGSREDKVPENATLKSQ